MPTNSHELASKLLETANILFKREGFTIPSEPRLDITFYVKEEFLAAIRAIGSGTKKFDYDFSFTPSGTDILVLRTARSNVCRKVQSEKWECEPLLTPDEFVAS